MSVLRRSLNLCFDKIEERSKLCYVLVFVVTTVDSGSKALEFLGLRQGIESNDPNTVSTAPVTHQVRKFLTTLKFSLSSNLSYYFCLKNCKFSYFFCLKHCKFSSECSSSV